jgi:cation:H+ antiporter
VVLGSNIFNLAMLLGLSAIVTGRVRIRRQGLALDGSVGLVVLLLTGALLLGWIPPVLALALLAGLLVPYVALVGITPSRVDSLRLPDGLAHLLAIAASQIHDADPGHHETEDSWTPVFLVPVALAVIVLASVWLVQSALVLAQAWHLPRAIVGGVILAGLTSLPNSYAAVHLASRGRGAAVVSATLNSNTINLVFGLALPAAILGLHGATNGLAFALAWLFGMTVIALLLLLPARGMTRLGGTILVDLYLLFVLAQLRWPGIA